MPWRPLLIFLLIAGAAFAASRLGWLPQGPRRNPKASAEPAAETRVSTKIFASGVIEGARRELPLGFEIPGRIRAVRAQEGDRVQAGDVLAELDTDAAELRLFEARAQLKIAIAERDRMLADSIARSQEAAKARLQEVERQLQEAEVLIQRTSAKAEGAAVSRKEVEQAKLKRERVLPQIQQLKAQAEEGEPQLTAEEETIAETRIKLAEAAVQLARLQLEQGDLRAPCDGVIVRVTAQGGELTSPQRPTPLFVLVDRSQTLVRAYVEEFDALRVAVGQKARIQIPARPESWYRGVVRTCAPQLTPKLHPHLGPGERVDVRVREVVIELEDGGDLLVGLPVEVWIEPGN